MNEGKIYLLPLGLEDTRVLSQISEAVGKVFGMPTDRCPTAPVPEYAYSRRRGQYHSTVILKSLGPHIPNDALRLLAVTDVDLYVPQLNFVFGETAVGGRECIISLYRLRPEFYGELPDEHLFGERAAKEAIHELGHAFGLHHCHDPHCVMYFSNDIQDTDRKLGEFCGKCEEKLKTRLDSLKATA